jgi:CRP/FNR family cyclic AMP-dependent transcriptional regulator
MIPETDAWRELIGYLASSLVLATFCVRDMATLRAFALASNLAFICYGYVAGIHPVLALHLLLLPTNVVRLSQLLRARRNPGRPVEGLVAAGSRRRP